MSTILSVGFGGFGNLSLNQLSTQQEPKESTALSLLNVKHISVGLWHSMIVTSHGKLYGVGRNRYGALGIGEPESLDQLNYLLPVEVPLSSGVKIMKACAGKTHSIALTDDGTLFSFGFGIACGHGHTTLTGVPEPVQYLFSYRVVDCSAGEGHSAAVTEDGKLFTWGLANRIKPVMVKSKEIDDELFVQVVCGAYHAIALTATGKLFGYGRNDDGQVNGETSCFISEECIVEIKHPLGEGHYWTQVSCGLKQTIALDNKGKVYIWGLIKDGLTSVSGSVKAPTLVDLSNLSSKVKKVMSGYSSFGILTQDGKLQTWGYNLHYNCCHGHNKFVQKPTMVESLSPMAINDVFMGAYNVFISCGLSATSDYSRLLHETCYFADCKLRASNGDEQVCHSCILSARSPYIAVLLFKSYVTNQLSTSCAKFTSTSEKLKAEIENILTLDFIEDGTQLSQVLDLLYTNISNNIKNPKKFDDIFNSYLFNTEKSIELLQSLGNADEGKKDQANLLIDFMKHQMTHEPLKTFSKCASGSIPEYSRDLVNLYSTTELEDCKQLSLFTTMSDVLFHFDDDTSINSHKAILCCRSEYFRAMFSIGQFMESSQKVIHLDNTPKDVFEILLRFIYAGEEISDESITAEQSVPLLELATRFNVETVKLAAERKIIRFLTPSNVVPMCSVADMCQALNVKKCCMHLIAKHFKAYTREDLEKELDSTLMGEIETLHIEYVKAAENQSANEQAVFTYMREQQEAADSLLDDEHRQHLVNEYDDDDMDMIQTILHGTHNPQNPVHAPSHRHTTQNNRGSGTTSHKKNCLFM